MPNRKEPRLEIETQEQEPQPKAKPVDETLPNETQATSKPPLANPASSSLKSWLAIFLALVALGLLAWQFMQSQQQQATLQNFAGRIQELELRLLETGDDLSAAGESFNSKLEWADAEIRKLWVVAHQRNRPAIETLETTAKQLNTSLVKLEKQLAEVTKTTQLASTQSTNLAKDVKKQTDELSFHVKELNQRLTEASLNASTLDQRLKDQDKRTQVASLEKRVADLSTKLGQQAPDNVQAKLVEQEEILKSLEASRNQLVSRVTRLMEEVRELQQAR